MEGKILLVDDETLTRKNIGQFLRDEGHEVEEAANGLEALELLSRQRFNVLISDFIMPHFDGFRLVDLVQSRWPDVSLLLITGYLSEEAGKAILEGKADVMNKPVNLTVLLHTIKAMVGTPNKG